MPVDVYRPDPPAEHHRPDRAALPDGGPAPPDQAALLGGRRCDPGRVARRQHACTVLEHKALVEVEVEIAEMLIAALVAGARRGAQQVLCMCRHRSMSM